MTKREFLDTVFALAPNEANKIMDAFDEYVESNEPHWIPVTERLPEDGQEILATTTDNAWGDVVIIRTFYKEMHKSVIAWMPLPEPYKGVTDGRD